MSNIREYQLAIDDLKSIVRDTLWMARRYAHGRSSYSTTMFNEALDKALNLGIGIQDDVTIGRYADDGMFGKWNPETKGWVKDEQD